MGEIFTSVSQWVLLRLTVVLDNIADDQHDM